MTFNPDEFRKYLEIDRNSLDDVLMRQPSLFERVGKELSQAIALKDQAKEDLGKTDSKLDIEIREKLDNDGVKTTESFIKAKIQVHKDHSAAFKTYLQAKQIVDELESLKESFKQRSFMLRHLCELYVANYFEDGSIRSTSNTDLVQYKERRRTISEARSKRQRSDG